MNAEGNGTNRARRRLWPVAVSIIALVLVGLFGGLIAFNMVSVRRSACKGDLAQIGHALRIYAAQHGVMVPPVVTDKAGRPMHSWRVLIMLHVGDPEFLDEYDLSQPWDSPHNLRVAAAPQNELHRRFFGCGHATDGTTHMVGVVGAGAYWDRLPDIPNADSPAAGEPRPVGVVVLEYWGKPIGWTEPRDLSPAEAIAYVTALRREKAFPTNGLLYYGSDGGTHYMPPDISDVELRRLFVDDER